MRILRTLTGLSAASLLLVAIGCGTPGAPQPPSLQLPKPINDLSGDRKGTRVVLAWTPPTQTTDKQNLRRMGPTHVCRAFNEFPMAQCRQLVTELNSSQLTTQAGTGRPSKVLYEDSISPEQMGASRFVTYAIEVSNDRGLSAGLSNQVRIPLVPTLPPPPDLSAEVTSDGVILHWTGAGRPQLPADAQGLEFRYRVYRRVAGQPNYSVIEETPAGKGEIAIPDKSFEWGQTYDYKVASVTVLPVAGGRPEIEIEGDDSPMAQVTVKDVFPPARPMGLQAVFSGVGQKPFIDLSWDPNGESDLQGYIVFRRQDGQPDVALNQEPVRSPSYRDQNVQPGQKYFYTVQAVDIRGNASEHSAEASEAVPEKF